MVTVLVLVMVMLRLRCLESAALCCKVPQHLDQGIGEGIQVDVEFAHCVRFVSMVESG